MPRGAEYDNGVPQSDNAVEAGHNIVHGDGKVTQANMRNSTTVLPNIELTRRLQPTSESDVSRSHKTAPLPEGLKESHDETHSGGGSRGLQGHTGSGKGGHEPKSVGQHKEVRQ